MTTPDADVSVRAAVLNILSGLHRKRRRRYRAPHRPRIRELEWSYLKKRKRPAGVMGRPPSPVPLVERKRLARQAYAAKLAARSMVTVKLLLPDEVARRLRELARLRNVTPGQYVADLLSPS